MDGFTFQTHRGKAAGLALIMAALTVASGVAVFLPDANLAERLAAVATTTAFAWGFTMAAGRLMDRRPAITVDSWGVRDRRMRVAAPWDQITGLRVWVQEIDAARATWIGLNVTDPDAVRSIGPIWRSVRHATLERWGRPPVALNLLGLKASTADVLGAIVHFRPDLRPG